MTLYEVLLFGHITAAIIWLGAAVSAALLTLGATRAGNSAKLAGYAEDSNYLAPRLYIPASLGTFIFGLLLVVEGAWDLGQLWVAIGLAGWLTSFLIGILYFKPESERLAEIAERRGPTHPEVEARTRRMDVLGYFELVILFVVVAAMVLKPTGDDTGVVVVGALLCAVAAGLAAVKFRRLGANVAVAARDAAH
ncbi:MAG TPA: DUF2269 family protein [Solirubrobacterales bacterium]|nr:DUF2269 family protein [Solirubrobacterales bacterium]